MNIIPVEEVTPLTPQAFYILLALAEKPMYGYGILQQCRLDAPNSISFDTGGTYRILRSLKSQGLIQNDLQLPSKGSPHTRQYLTLTSTGQMVLSWECRRYREAAFLGQHRLSTTEHINRIVNTTPMPNFTIQ
jgi:DNA-binding PadR family transcriptional regulator